MKNSEKFLYIKKLLPLAMKNNLRDQKILICHLLRKGDIDYVK